MVYVAGEYSLLFFCFMVFINLLPLKEMSRFFMNLCLVMLYMIGLMEGVHTALFGVAGTILIGG